MGYAGGTTPNPTYRNLGDHTETIQIDFDPDQIPYEDLLALFWKGHDPTERSRSKQYMAVLFFHNDNQKRLAMITRDRLAAQRGKAIYTQIFPASEFTLAETYHQKHALRGHGRLMEVFNPLYREHKGLYQCYCCSPRQWLCRRLRHGFVFGTGIDTPCLAPGSDKQNIGNPKKLRQVEVLLYPGTPYLFFMN